MRIEYFTEFKANVEKWSEVRGIYDQSSESCQQAKALEEIGEFLTAQTIEEKMDAIGDIAVCIVNAAKFNNVIDVDFSFQTYGAMPIGSCSMSIINGAYRGALKSLNQICENEGFLFEDCLKMAWHGMKSKIERA